MFESGRVGCGAAHRDLAQFYAAIGMPLVEGYGLTEGGVVALNPLDTPEAGRSASRSRTWKCGSRTTAS